MSFWSMKNLVYYFKHNCSPQLWRTTGPHTAALKNWDQWKFWNNKSSRTALWVNFVSRSAMGTQGNRLRHGLVQSGLSSFHPQYTLLSRLRVCAWFLLFHCLPMVTWAGHSLSFFPTHLSLKQATAPHGWKKCIPLVKHLVGRCSFHSSLWPIRCPEKCDHFPMPHFTQE